MFTHLGSMCMHRFNLRYFDWHSFSTHLWNSYCVLDSVLGQSRHNLCLYAAYLLLKETNINQISVMMSGINERHEMPLRML